MSDEVRVPPRLVYVPVHVYAHDSGGPGSRDVPDIKFRLLVCQTMTIRCAALALARRWSRFRKPWAVGTIVDRDGDEFEDAGETVWAALELLPIGIFKAAPTALDTDHGLSYAHRAAASFQTGGTRRRLGATTEADASRACAAQELASRAATTSLVPPGDFPSSPPTVGEGASHEGSDGLGQKSRVGGPHHAGVYPNRHYISLGTRNLANMRAATRPVDGLAGEMTYARTMADPNLAEIASSPTMSIVAVRARHAPARYASDTPEKGPGGMHAHEERWDEKKYEDDIDKRLWRAQQEAERQSSAAKMERTERGLLAGLDRPARVGRRSGLLFGRRKRRGALSPFPSIEKRRWPATESRGGLVMTNGYVLDSMS